jgi:hypothetical protein
MKEFIELIITIVIDIPIDIYICVPMKSADSLLPAEPLASFCNYNK